jgi:actin-like ATPase involved in cell morphogenesis
VGYRLGVDLGTTWTACAVHRAPGVEIVPLGDHGAEVPSVVFLREDGTFLIGEAAERRGLAAPHRLAREFKRRIGDPTPLLLAGTPYSAHALTATLLRWVVERVVEREGSTPDAVVVTCPANWGPYKRESLQHGVALADVGGARLVTEPEAAALRYASLERLEVGDVVAVYDLGGGTFDTAVLARTPEGFTLRGAPVGIEQLGGVDFDDALFSHVVEALGPDVEDLEPDDEATTTALARLRRDCVQAKEALSSDTEVTVPVGLPGLHTTVRVTRAEFEDLVRPPVADTVRALRRALRSAQVEPEQLTAVLLAGGSSRIPLVAETLSAELGRPVAVDAHPKHLVALGAALAGAPAAALTPAAQVDPASIPGPRAAVSSSAPAAARPYARGPEPGQRQDAPPQQESAAPVTASGVGSRRTRRPAAGRASPRVLLGLTLALTAVTLVIAAVGLGDVRTGPGPGRRLPAGTILVNGVDPAGADAVIELGLDGDDDVAVPRAGGVADVELTLRLLGVPRPGTVPDVGERRSLDLSSAPSLFPGRTVGTVTALSAEDEVLGRATFIADPEDPPLLSVPGIVGLVLLLFCLAYGESLAGTVRRGRRLGLTVLVGAVALGAGAGVAVAVLGWALLEHLLLPEVLVACAVLGAAAAGCGMRLLATRAASVSR